MAKKAADVFRDALALSPEERAELVRLLDLSSPPARTADRDAYRAWEDEIRRRVAALESGETGLIPAEEVFSQVRERLRRSAE